MIQLQKRNRVELWKDLGMDGPYGLAGVGTFANCYDNSFWICGDGYDILQRRIDATTLNVIDSLSAALTPYGIGWDGTANNLIGVSWYSNIIYRYNIDTEKSEKVFIDLELDYEKTKYKSDKIMYALIKPNRNLVLLVERTDYYDESTKFIYLYDNVIDLNLLNTYKFPDEYELDSYEGISIFNGDLYLDADKIILK